MQTFPLRTELVDLKNPRGGFTLIEVMVVLTIIGAVVALVIPRLGNRSNMIKGTLRHLSVLMKEVHNHSRLYGATYRVVFDLRENSSEEQTYWVERSTRKTLLAKDKASVIEQANSKDSEDKKPKSDFEVAVQLLKEKKAIPQGLRIKDIEVAGIDNPISNGKAFIHFFPEGRVEEAVVHLASERNVEWSLSPHPLTGKVAILTKRVSLSELKAK